MGFRTVYGNDLLRSVACPPLSIASSGANLALSMKSVLTQVSVFWGVLMAFGTMSLGVVSAGTSSVFQRRNLFQVSRIHAVLALAKLLDMVKLHAFANGSNQKFPDQAVTKRSSSFPIGKGVAIFPHGKPQPATIFADCNFSLKSLWQGFKEVHV
jgi:hypothetical protein